MSAQTSPSRTWTPPLERGRRRAAPERPANRAVGAAIVAGGPALIVLLYPLPDGPRLLDPFQPEQESSSKSAKVVESTFLKVGADLGICRGSGVDSNRSPKFGASRSSSLGIRCGSVSGTCRTHGFSTCRTRGSGTCRTPAPAPVEPPVSAPDPLSVTSSEPDPPQSDPPSSSTDAGCTRDSGGGSSGGSPGGE
jgi:hypothetical protein